MAIYPCDFDGRPYPQGQQTLFVHFVEQGTELGGKLRLCPRHMESFMTEHTPNMVLTQRGEDPMDLDEDDLPHCMQCGDLEFRVQVFAHVYQKGMERLSYWGGVCETCRPSMVQMWTKAT